MRMQALAGALALAVLSAAGAVQGRAAGPDRTYVPVASGSLVQDKDFYLLSLLRALPRTQAAVAGDPELARAAQARRARLKAASATCADDTACLIAALSWSDQEADALGARLVEALARAGALDELVERHMRPSGRFARYANLDDREMARRAFVDAARAMDHILKVYGLGEPPLYPKIDSASYPPGDKFWKETVGDMARTALDDQGGDELFFELPLSAALDVLDFNDRDEPACMEPLAAGENAKAMAYARTLDWKSWTYTAILIPGRSPVLSDDPLSPIGKLKVRLGLRRWKAGLAPLIVVSGGFVNPSQTHFNEALEMKRELMRVYHVPERAILIDPFARHTTTNIRNTERLLFEAGAPLDRPIVITAVLQHSQYIEGQVFHDRCLHELGYVPFTIRRRLSPYDLEADLSLTSLHRDAADPLDP